MYLSDIISKQIIDSKVIFANTDPDDKEKVKALENMFGGLNPDARVLMHEAGSEGNRISDFLDMIV